jgi:AAHS family 4-hydroxybenzoate transporter-like MFS transporter
MRTTTLVLGIGFFMSMGLNALLASWLPSFFHELAGVAVQRFAGIVMYTAPAAVVGMLAAGWLWQRMPTRLLVLLFFGSHCLALILIGSFDFASGGFIIALAGLSFGQAACQALLNLVIVSCYPGALRATALGGAAAVGRAGGIFAPAIGALALEAQPSMQVLFVLLGAVPVVTRPPR